VSETGITADEALARSDVIITGVPSENYKLNSSSLKDGVVLVNFSTFKNIGEDCQAKGSIYVPSVGKVTIAMLQRNLIRLYDYQSQ
jgi:methylenetetrahydrofolate dehydrogenase (NAD+)